jgi:hypothetical protein
MRLYALPLVIAAAAGCQTPAEWYEVRIRDPSAVSLEIETPHGTKVLLPAGASSAEITVPRTAPPYRGDVLYEASAIREESGAIAMRCDACIRKPLTHLLPADGSMTIQLDPSTAATFRPRWTTDALRLPLAQQYFVPAGRHSVYGPYEAFRYDVVIPRDALVEVRKKREDLRGAGLEELVGGAVLTAAAAAVMVLGVRGAMSTNETANAWGTIGIVLDANILLPVAVMMDIIGISHSSAPAPYDTKVDWGGT